MISLILNRVTRVVLHIILLFSIFVLFKGHNEPGGGFIAGLMTSVAIILVYVAYDIEVVTRAIPINFKLVIAAGLVFAAGTGVGALVFGYPFLSHTFGYFHIPLLGEIELATAFGFDIGVYLVVVGATLLIIETLGGESR
jgi:multicomponent Na+:H+ antiporter subunit B